MAAVPHTLKIWVLATAVLALGGCTAGATFQWFDGQTYRRLPGPTGCAPDGSLVLWQRANSKGDFNDATDVNVGNCIPAA